MNEDDFAPSAPPISRENTTEIDVSELQKPTKIRSQQEVLTDMKLFHDLSKLLIKTTDDICGLNYFYLWVELIEVYINGITYSTSVQEQLRTYLNGLLKFKNGASRFDYFGNKKEIAVTYKVAFMKVDNPFVKKMIINLMQDINITIKNF